MPKAHNVIARYGTFFQGSDDFFTHCLILDNGECWLLGQGLRPVTLRVFKAPAAWVEASYSGYNFITDAESPAATEIAVFGLKAGTPPALGSYFVPPPDSDIAKLVKEIADIDPGV